MAYEFTMKQPEKRQIVSGFVHLISGGIMRAKNTKLAVQKIGQNQPNTRLQILGALDSCTDASKTKAAQLMKRANAIFVKFAVSSMTSGRDPLVGG